MTVLPMGKVTGAFPAPGSAAYLGLVHEIHISTDPAAQTGYVSVTKGGVVLRTFNIGAANGSNDDVYRICAKGGVDPTQFSITQTVAGEGALVVYLIT